MKFVALFALLLSPVLSEASPLHNCFTAKKAQFFALEMEDLAKAGETPVLLLNEAKEVVGVISANPARAEKYPFAATTVSASKLYLCSSLEVSDFYYTDGTDDNLMTWLMSGKSDIEMSQDEGMIRLSSKIETTDRYATLIRVDFKAYDVFSDEEDLEREKNLPDFLPDWGAPKGRGTFYFYAPKNWTFKK